MYHHLNIPGYFESEVQQERWIIVFSINSSLLEEKRSIVQILFVKTSTYHNKGATSKNKIANLIHLWNNTYVFPYYNM